VYRKEVRWEKGGTERAKDYTFCCGKGNEDHQLGTVFSYIRESYQQLGKQRSVSDRMSYIILRGRWFNIIVLNVHAPCEDKSDDVKYNLYGELARVSDQFSRYVMKILLSDFNAKVGREDIFKPII
jgi:hypothetical protein